MIMNISKHILSIASGTLLSVLSTVAQSPSIKATLDSAYITMGNITALNVEIVEGVNAFSQVGFVPGTVPPEVEVVGEADSDTTLLSNDIRQITRRIILQSFDSGVYNLPPVLYMNAGDTMLSNMVTLKVNPVDVSELEDIHGNADVMKLPSRWYDFLPDWIINYWGWLLLTIILVAGGVCAVLIYNKKLPVAFYAPKKVIPPYEMAIQRLGLLREQHLCERGQEREYYTELTDILREYIDKRFGINAMEMTSRQILEHLNRNETTRPSERLMRRILEVADFVKFAKMRPLPEDNARSYSQAVEFVENTRPVQEENVENESTEITKSGESPL